MKKLLCVLLICVITSAGLIEASACGDKTMRVGGIRFNKILLRDHHANILIYSPAIPKGKAPQLTEYLQKNGQKTKYVEDAGSFRAGAVSGQYDLILTDLADAGTLKSVVEASSPRTMVVPVVLKPSKADKAAAKRYKVVVTDPESGEDFLIAVWRVYREKSRSA